MAYFSIINMFKCTPEQLLVLAFIYEKTCLADLSSSKIHYSVRSALKSLLGKEISDENVSLWLNINQSILGDMLNNSWLPTVGSGIKHIFAFDNTKSIGDTPYIQKIFASDQNSEIEKNMDVKETAILSGVQDIPNLWLYKGYHSDWELNSKLDVNQAHNYFIIDALKSIFHIRSQKSETVEKLNDFFAKNDKKINKLRSSISGTPKKIGEGADGVAFAINPTTVLKIFKDDVSYKNAIEAFNRLYKNPDLAKTEAMIYDVGILGYWDDQPLYYYIQELMKLVKTNDLNFNLIMKEMVQGIAKIVTYYKSDLKNLKIDIKDPLKSKNIKEDVAAWAQAIAAEYKHNNPKETAQLIHARFPQLKDNWLELFAEEMIMKYLTGRTDLHIGNLGVTNYGELRYFDPSYSGYESKINT